MMDFIKVLKDFPVLEHKIKNIVLDADANSFMAIKPTKNADGYVLYIGKETFKSIKNVKNAYKNDVKAGYSVQNSTYKDILTHELGHALNLEIIKKQYTGDLNRIANDYNNSITANQIVEKALDNIKIFNLSNRELKIKNISNYAYENKAECIAEAFCDYYVMEIGLKG